MRVCEKHRERAVEILVSKISGAEYDLCKKCSDELAEILFESELSEEIEHQKVKRGRKRIT